MYRYQGLFFGWQDIISKKDYGWRWTINTPEFLVSWAGLAMGELETIGFPTKSDCFADAKKVAEKLSIEIVDIYWRTSKVMSRAEEKKLIRESMERISGARPVQVLSAPLYFPDIE